MRRRSRAGGEPTKVRRRKTAARKRRGLAKKGTAELGPLKCHCDCSRIIRGQYKHRGFAFGQLIIHSVRSQSPIS